MSNGGDEGPPGPARSGESTEFSYQGGEQKQRDLISKIRRQVRGQIRTKQTVSLEGMKNDSQNNLKREISRIQERTGLKASSRARSNQANIHNCGGWIQVQDQQSQEPGVRSELSS